MFKTKADEAYNNDPEFHRLVDMLESMLTDSRFTPSEVRMAAVLACCHREMRRTDAVFIVAEAQWTDPERYGAPPTLTIDTNREAGSASGSKVMYAPIRSTCTCGPPLDGVGPSHHHTYGCPMWKQF